MVFSYSQPSLLQTPATSGPLLFHTTTNTKSSMFSWKSTTSEKSCSSISDNSWATNTTYDLGRLYIYCLIHQVLIPSGRCWTPLRCSTPRVRGTWRRNSKYLYQPLGWYVRAYQDAKHQMLQGRILSLNNKHYALISLRQ